MYLLFRRTRGERSQLIVSQLEGWHRFSIFPEEVHILLCYKFHSIYEQISLVNKTGNQQSVNICYYLLITRRYRFTAGPTAGENVFLPLTRGSLERVANAICKCETN